MRSIEKAAEQKSDGITSLLWCALRAAPHYSKDVDGLMESEAHWKAHGPNIQAALEWMEAVEADPADYLGASDIRAALTKLKNHIKELKGWHSASFRLDSLQALDHGVKAVLSIAEIEVGKHIASDTCKQADELISELIALVSEASSLFPMDEGLRKSHKLLEHLQKLRVAASRHLSLKIAVGATQEDLTNRGTIAPDHRTALENAMRAGGTTDLASAADLQSSLDALFWQLSSGVAARLKASDHDVQADILTLQLFPNLLPAMNSIPSKKVIAFLSEVRQMLADKSTFLALGDDAVARSSHKDSLKCMIDSIRRIIAVNEAAAHAKSRLGARWDAEFKCLFDLVAPIETEVKASSVAFEHASRTRLEQQKAQLQSKCRGGPNGCPWHESCKSKTLKAITKHATDTILCETFAMDELVGDASKLRQDIVYIYIYIYMNGAPELLTCYDMVVRTCPQHE
jgi:hypothetical protein